MKRTIIVGASCDLGFHIDGASLGPKEILDKLKIENILLNQKNNYVKEKSSGIKNETALKQYLENLYEIICKQYEMGNQVIVLGGDHSVAISSALASNKYNGPLGLIWIDAHTDYHVHSSTVSGNLHGLPCAIVNGKDIEWLSFQYDFISDDNTVIVGARDIDGGEYINLKKSKVTLFDKDKVNEFGLCECLEKAFEIALNKTKGVHISLDLDYFDPEIAPGVTTSASNGGKREDLEIICKYLKKYSNEIKSIDIVEYNPLFDKDKKTLKLALELLDALEIN